MCPWITETVKLSFHFLIIRNLLHLCDSYQKPTFSSTVDSARNWIMVMFIHLFLFWIYYSSPFKISIILYHGSVVRKSGWLPEGGNLMKLFDNLIFLLSCKYFPMQSLYYPGPPTQVHTGTLFTWMMWTQSYWSGLAFYFLWWIACKTFLKRTYIGKYPDLVHYVCIKTTACFEGNFQSIKWLFYIITWLVKLMQGKTTLTDYIRLIKSLPFFDRSIKYIFWKMIPKAMLVKTNKSFSLIKYVILWLKVLRKVNNTCTMYT